MEMYSAHVELARKRISPDVAEKIHDELDGYHPAVGHSPRGWVDAQISLPAEHLAQATQTAVAVVEAAARAAGVTASAVAVEVMTEAEFNVRQGHAGPSGYWEERRSEAFARAGGRVVGSTEAAEFLGVTRQRVMQWVNEGRLHSERVGARAHGFDMEELERFARMRTPS